MKTKTLVLVGKSGVGKSCLLRRWTGLPFTSSFICTIGVDVAHREMCLPSGEQVKLKIWDLASCELGESPCAFTYYRLADVICVVYDVTDERSLEAAARLLQSVRTSCGHAALHLVGNKADCVGRRVPTANANAKARTLAATYGVRLWELSAATASSEELETMLGSIVCSTSCGPLVPSAVTIGIVHLCSFARGWVVLFTAALAESSVLWPSDTDSRVIALALDSPRVWLSVAAAAGCGCGAMLLASLVQGASMLSESWLPHGATVMLKAHAAPLATIMSALPLPHTLGAFPLVLLGALSGSMCVHMAAGVMLGSAARFWVIGSCVRKNPSWLRRFGLGGALTRARCLAKADPLLPT